MVEHASELVFKNDFRLCPPSSMGISGGILVFPAIAIPIARKREFQCPDRNLSVLEALLPQIDKILIVGWRGTEDHFLNMLRKKLRPRVHMTIVAGDVELAQEVGVNLQHGLLNIAPRCHAASGGFTDFVCGPALKQFLSHDTNH
jgi:hypothetical protein